MNQGNTTDTNLLADIERYRRAPKAVEHEQLLQRVQRAYGTEVGRFFDQERQLPLEQKSWDRWPLSPGERSHRRAVLSGIGIIAFVLLVSVSFLVVKWMGVDESDPTIFQVMASVLGVALILWVARSVYDGITRPSESEGRERLRLQDEYVSIVLESQRAAEAAAERARQDRLSGDA